MIDRELMQQALDALDLLARYENPATKVQVRKPRDGGTIVTMYPHKVATEAAVPLRARLAQPEQPNYSKAGFGKPQGEEGCAGCGKKASKGWALYCVKCSEREWVGLTDEEIEQIVDAHWNDPSMFVEAIEAKLKEKNG